MQNSFHYFSQKKGRASALRAAFCRLAATEAAQRETGKKEKIFMTPKKVWPVHNKNIFCCSLLKKR